ncbi:unnamed protein product [Chondrus crispus]|uniref:Uncharacterized protein n=1 Tax=Chondrus crispus TaxID=2769 RepID=R7QUZ4_CHOCR|nr:unnamed protein product [Chondrus crispus]CDF41180.1 unnamed protein product [Chondrus crispus]|eukprot:XP_005711474.1 unnamed protein product [Chondrus crispus]
MPKYLSRFVTSQSPSPFASRLHLTPRLSPGKSIHPRRNHYYAHPYRMLYNTSPAPPLSPSPPAPPPPPCTHLTAPGPRRTLSRPRPCPPSLPNAPPPRPR